MSPDSFALDLTFVELHPDPSPVTEQEVASLCRYVLGREGGTGEWPLSVVLTTDQHLRELHGEFMGLDSETDIMTFPVGDELPGGDIVISVDRAAEQCADAGHTLRQEVLFLVSHGLLHLAGWDDATDDQRAAMLARQAALIAEWDQDVAG